MVITHTGLPRCIDTHCHLGFSEKGFKVAQALPHIRFACMTCDPQNYLTLSKEYESIPNVVVAAGLHPRWIANGICGQEEIDLLCQIAETERYIGEIGIDLLEPYSDSLAQQTHAFNRIIQACTTIGEKVISIHALRSTSLVLDTLQKHNALENCACILHWFSGSNEDLHRAIQMGCWFSVNDRMLTSRKGREYTKVIPKNRLLIESDLPSQPEDVITSASIQESLDRTIQLLETIRQIDCAQTCLNNAKDLFCR